MNGGVGTRVLTSTGSAGISYANSKLTFDGSTLTVTGSIYASGDITGLSDERFKNDVVTIADALTLIKKLRGVYYTTQDTKLRRTGVIAQELEAILPELVVDRADGYKAVKYDRIIALLIEAVKAQQHQIDELKRR